MFALAALSLLSLAPFMLASPVRRCTGTISSLDDVAAAILCTTASSSISGSINVNSFTVPAGKTLQIDAPAGATVNGVRSFPTAYMQFGYKEWNGPLFFLTGSNITFNGNGHTFNGQGEQYWDGLGSSGVVKPHPMMKVKSSGTFSNLIIKNSPRHCFSFGNSAPLVVSKVTVDNGKYLVLEIYLNQAHLGDSTVHNQDDCLAINEGSNIVFQRNSCTGGHGISIGSIDTNVTVSNVQILNNVVTNNDQALRIKTIATATGASVSGITYSGNTATGCKRFGVIIDQSYPSTLGTPGNGVKISAVTFSGTNNIAVTSSAQRVAVNCGTGCTGE
ncbi:hypothetical protein FRC10_009199 [Ceratobasidium sp. 414]|nr:hypothetical protein FRC10_009199 [Ceratobasidium sp. 414]